MKPKTILITGAARGLGLALVEESARLHYKVFAIVRRSEDAAMLEGRFRGRCETIVADLCDPSSEGKIAEVLERNEVELNLLINNAGLSGEGSKLTEVEFKEVDDLFQIHCVAMLRCTRAALPSLLRPPRSMVVNINSRLGSISKVASGEFDSENHSYAYRIAKASQNMATACLRRELGARGIAVIAVHPGRLSTTLSSHTDGKSPSVAAKELLDLISRTNAKTDLPYTNIHGEPLDW